MDEVLAGYLRVQGPPHVAEQAFVRCAAEVAVGPDGHPAPRADGADLPVVGRVLRLEGERVGSGACVVGPPPGGQRGRVPPPARPRQKATERNAAGARAVRVVRWQEIVERPVGVHQLHVAVLVHICGENVDVVPVVRREHRREAGAFGADRVQVVGVAAVGAPRVVHEAEGATSAVGNVRVGARLPEEKSALLVDEVPGGARHRRLGFGPVPRRFRLFALVPGQVALAHPAHSERARLPGARLEVADIGRADLVRRAREGPPPVGVIEVVSPLGGVWGRDPAAGTGGRLVRGGTVGRDVVPRAQHGGVGACIEDRRGGLRGRCGRRRRSALAREQQGDEHGRNTPVAC